MHTHTQTLTHNFCSRDAKCNHAFRGRGVRGARRRGQWSWSLLELLSPPSTRHFLPCVPACSYPCMLGAHQHAWRVCVCVCVRPEDEKRPKADAGQNLRGTRLRMEAQKFPVSWCTGQTPEGTFGSRTNKACVTLVWPWLSTPCLQS